MHATADGVRTAGPVSTCSTVAELSTGLAPRGRALAADASAARRPGRRRRGHPADRRRRAGRARDWRDRAAPGKMSGRMDPLVDAAVQEAYRMARFQSGQTSIVAPLTVVATGAYGDRRCGRIDRCRCCWWSLPIAASLPVGGWPVPDAELARVRPFPVATVVAGRQPSEHGRLLAGSATLFAGRSAVH